MTTGGPDTADIYELKLNADNPLQYRYDDEWRDFKVRSIELNIKGVPAPVKQPVYESHHGPVIALRDGKAYAHRMAYWDQVEGNEAWKYLGYARDYTGAVDAMATLQVFPQNVMVADTSGNIYYQRTCGPRIFEPCPDAGVVRDRDRVRCGLAPNMRPRTRLVISSAPRNASSR
jgi:acyl-homoserine-lactone acylase